MSVGHGGDGRVRNVVLVTIDSLRADHCGVHEPPQDAAWSGSLTPTIDDLGADGLVFERAVAPGPRTPSSMPVAFTGEPLSIQGVYASGEEKRHRWRARCDRVRRHMRRHRTVAERFGAAGYETAAVTANPWTTTDTGFDEGFDEFHEVGRRADGETTGLLVGLLDRVTDVDRNGWLLTWPDYYDQVLAAREALSEPYFLWVFLLDPHQPYLAPRRFREEGSLAGSYYSNLRYNRFHGYVDELPGHLHRGLQRAYRDAIRSADGFLERLLGDLEDRRDDPVTCVHADHGEAFAEHGFYGHRPHLYEENVRVPLVLSGTEAGGRPSDPVSLAAIPDLLVEAATGSVTPGAHVRPYVHASTEERERVAVRTRRYKYLSGGSQWPYVLASSGRELYDLATDPGERSDLVTERADAVPLFKRLLDRRRSDLGERRRIADAAEVVDGA